MSTRDSSFDGLRVASFESRRAEEMERMIAKMGGVPFVSPSMREVALERNQAAIDFANAITVAEMMTAILLSSGRGDTPIESLGSLWGQTLGTREVHQATGMVASDDEIFLAVET